MENRSARGRSPVLTIRTAPPPPDREAGSSPVPCLYPEDQADEDRCNRVRRDNGDIPDDQAVAEPEEDAGKEGASIANEMSSVDRVRQVRTTCGANESVVSVPARSPRRVTVFMGDPAIEIVIGYEEVWPAARRSTHFRMPV